MLDCRNKYLQYCKKTFYIVDVIYSDWIVILDGIAAVTAQQLNLIISHKYGKVPINGYSR